MADRYDVIVVGVGGMGSAAAYHLARRGKGVLGLERFAIPNDMGSSHGQSRIIRVAYFEGQQYVPLVQRAYDLWSELEREAGQRLLRITGSLEISLPGTALVSQSQSSCDFHHLDYEILTGPAISKRFPAFGLPDDAQALLQPQGGFLNPEGCVLAQAEAARKAGAVLRVGDPALSWQASSGGGVLVVSESGVHEAEQLIITAGPWASTLVPELQQLAVPERQVMTWLTPARPELFAGERFPVFIMETDEGHFYGLPLTANGLKVARHHHLKQPVDANTVEREIHREDVDLTAAFVRQYLPAGEGPVAAARVCLYTNSPDGDFIVDRHPEHDNVLIAAGFSGHGFKFCPVIGEILADLAIEGRTEHDIGLFRLDRFKELSQRTA